MKEFQKMEIFLQREDLWTVVSNPLIDLNEELQKQNEKTLASIILCLEDSQVIYVCGITSAREN